MFHAEKPFRLDRNITLSEINEWLDEQAKKVIEKKNEEVKKNVKQLYIKQFNQTLRKKLAVDGFKIEYEKVSNGITDEPRGCVERKRGDVGLSLKFPIQYVFKDEYIEEVKEDSGLINANITSVGN